ncbi:glycoside hydrolase family 38 N-terminal domain-containing protein [Haloplasma contractile]|uniref:Alpha-mannosidase protein n=1 Tax=Haloplasma contractile SSD-17B TaxID=1033810 RepID=U2FLN0_9MOLU|nr:glycoside hydrolase family 38 C-terminal domain-containing protein [Haloplasma contractile]ERJ13655.1 alpha-mannosidase protein [Haloplasma contractile SSD-17B]
MAKKTLNIVFQTHWDREWYYSFEYYRHRLTQVIDRVVDALDHDEIDYFVFDGQVAALQDFYDVADDHIVNKVKEYVKSGKIVIGPWYVLADEFLVTGESLIRNLEIGMDFADREGKSQRLGYLPDTFGHISQMPQILKGFDIHDAVIWRGIVPKTSELTWQSPDGTDVFTVFLPQGYYQPIVDQPKYEELMDTYLKNIEPFATTDELLLTNGGDHLMPAKVDIRERLETLEKKYSDYEFKITNFKTYIDQLKSKVNHENLPIYKGELRDNSNIHVLPNVLSTRSYLKKDNQLIEDQILGYTEPLMVLTYNKDEHEPKKYMKETWKLLMENHPHDSICGCSIDEVHREMETRTLKLKQRLDMLEKGSLQHKQWYEYTLHGAGANQPIFDDLKNFLVFNPHPYSYTGELELNVYIRKELDEILDGFILRDQEGKEYKPVVCNVYHDRSFESPTDYFPEFRGEIYYDIVIRVEDFKALSLKEFEIVPGNYEHIKIKKDRYLENEFVKIELNDNRLNLFDKVENVYYDDINHFYSSLDNGDEYNYSKPVNDVITDDYDITNLRIEKSSFVQKMYYTVNMTLPKELSRNRKGASKEQVKNTIDVELTLYQNSDKLHVKTVINNQAQDHRLRTTFNTGTKLAHSYSDSAFSIEKREIRDEVFECDPKYGNEVPVVVDPSLSMVYAANKEQGLVINHRGLQEYQMVNHDNHSVIELTLMRNVGWLSRDDFRSRGGGAGPSFETPEAQCIGTYEFEYTIAPVKKECSVAEYLTDAHVFRNPLKVYKGKLNDDQVQNVISIDNKKIQWSSLRKIDQNVYLRLWNPTNEELTFNLDTKIDFKRLISVQLNHKEIEVLDESKITIKPNQIMTICFER